MGRRRNAPFSGLSNIARQVFGEQPNVNVVPQPKKQQRPAKRRKTDHQKNYKNDATGLVPFYSSPSQVPEHLRKYFSQRERYFSLYDNGCLLDEEGWYSVTPELIANQIAERCRCDTIIDAFCGVGGNTIAFAQTCERVIALDNSPTRLALARHNAAIYGVADRIEFVLTDYLDFVRAYLSSSSAESSHRRNGTRTIDVVFLSPPWGGPDYLNSKKHHQSSDPPTPKPGIIASEYYTLANLQPAPGAELFNLTRQITPNVAFYLPRNANLEEIAALVGTKDDKEQQQQQDDQNGKRLAPEFETQKLKPELERVEVEEEWMGTKLKALTCYFGGLVTGQEHLF